jgi:exopolysaccharide biosynthesis polyprenyl glycosylphosphotransferase
LLFTYLVLVVIFEYIGRVLLKRVIRRQKLKDKNKSEMIVVAESDTVERCLDEIAHNKYTDFKVVGVVVVDADLEGQTIQGIPVVANADDFLEYVRTNVVDEVYIDGNTRASSEALANTLVELGVTVHISLVHTNYMMPNMVLENYASYVVLTTSMHIASTRQLFLKRLMDIVGSIIGLIITFIAFIIFAPIIKIQSPGPVFYKQIRIGKNGRRFTFYKFRSMYVDADKRKKELMEANEMDGNMFKMEDDPRIIPIGRFMRKYSIDELPQFFNVLKGDMSLVGTRPPTEDEYEMYKFHHKARLGFKPGLTGMWQISGRSDITNFEDVVAYDTEYIANWNIWLDIKILFKTIGVVLSGKGSK